ncbi:MAG: hypothetical protein ACE5OS_05665 [Anaerolineae bacterium]
MNSQLAKEFRGRWQAVAAIEAEEQREASIALRWQQTNAILRLATGLGLPLAERDSAEIEAVRRRWALLKGAATECSLLTENGER